MYVSLILQTDDGEDDLKKGTQLLEIYALEIQMYTAQVQHCTKYTIQCRIELFSHD